MYHLLISIHLIFAYLFDFHLSLPGWKGEGIQPSSMARCYPDPSWFHAVTLWIIPYSSAVLFPKGLTVGVSLPCRECPYYPHSPARCVFTHLNGVMQNSGGSVCVSPGSPERRWKTRHVGQVCTCERERYAYMKLVHGVMEAGTRSSGDPRGLLV